MARELLCSKAWSHGSYAFVIAVVVQDTGVVVDRGFGDKQVRNRRSVPHPAMVGQVALKPMDSVEDVRGRVKGLITAQRLLLAVVIGG